VTHRILSLDTTSEHGSLALLAGGQVVEEVSMRSAEGFGHLLFPRIEALLARNGWKLADVDCFAGAAGPGSFTGIRVGLAAVKGLAEALGKEAAAVSNLQAIAWHGTAPLRAAVIDARRGEIYGAVYSASLELEQAETVTGPREWLTRLPDGELEILSTDLGRLAEELDHLDSRRALVREVPRALAGAVGAIAACRLVSGTCREPAAIDANYVRRSDAELFWREW
jgi:tRNA threonylcarbamoyladenosine biosynthesis protein TsaB